MPPPAPLPAAALGAAQAAGDVYAQALLDLVGDDAAAEAVADELAALLGLLDEIDGFEPLLTGDVLRHRDLAALVHRVFAGRCSRTVLSFLAVLARRGRMGLLRPAVARFRALLDARRGKVEVVATTAAPLDAAGQEQVRRTVRRALGVEASVRFAVDQRLLGGLSLRVGNRLYDASASTRLDLLARRLAEEPPPGR